MDKRKDDGIFIKKVLEFYTKFGRHTLEWRKKISPYSILVSEIMLQQTQVTRVLPKYKAWMRKYPTLKSLRKASLQELLVLWQGLGYQRRVKALYEIGKMYTVLPQSFEKLITLPSVGEYTASALCAFAYNSFAHPLLETNIRTALIEEYHIKKKKIKDEILYSDLIRLESTTVVKKVGARTWYYALMDYGAHLKETHISHNTKSSQYRPQSSYIGSVRQLRAQVLFAITYGKPLPKDKRIKKVISTLVKEGYIERKNKGYEVVGK